MTVLYAAVYVSPIATGDELAPIGLQKQLLVDDFAVAEKQNVQRVLGVVTKANGGRPILVADKPWEDDVFGFYGTVLHDGDKFRMWYHPWAYAVAYAESDDGLRWRKPVLGLFDFSIERAKQLATDEGFRPREGAPLNWHGKRNNIIGFFGDGFTCFLDEHETDPDHRYKACYGPIPQIRAAIAHSPDGIHWTPYNNGEPVTGRASDTYNQLLWDEGTKTYRLLTRTDYFGPNKEEVRGSRVMVNPDVKANPTAWETVREWKFDREGPEEFRRRQIYGMTDWIYEGIHFGLMMVYEWPEEGPGDMAQKAEGADHHKRHERDVMNFYIAPCRDGANWDLDWVYAEKPLVPRGPDGSFDKDMIIQASNIVTWQDKHWIYYTGYRERHWCIPRKPSIGLATLPLDRFVGLQAGQQPGTVTTKPFVLDGDKLALNVDAAQGAVAVDVLDADGKPIEGFSSDGCRFENIDQLRFEPQWESQKSLKELQGRTVRLRLTLQNATLYAFQIQR